MNSKSGRRDTGDASPPSYRREQITPTGSSAEMTSETSPDGAWHDDKALENNSLPPYGGLATDLELSEEDFDAQASVTCDGRVNIHIDQKSSWLSNDLFTKLQDQTNAVSDLPEDHPPRYLPSYITGAPGQVTVPAMNIVIQVIGSRGDVQPVIALAKVLKTTYGHRVRLATHPKFQGFVEENGIEFYSLGGDPSQLMDFMVKNRGLLPSMDALRNGDIARMRKFMSDVVQACWQSCIAPATDGRPFVADAIIANPPSFAHIHCAEKLGIPLHLMFTMPWTPSQAFPHPMANIRSSNAAPNLANFMSYNIIDMLTWRGLGDIINRFRKETLGLEPISLLFAPGLACRLKIPVTYCWSPTLLPKPKDWGTHISVCGNFTDSSMSDYTPEASLVSFLDKGEPPVYIGFGSVELEDPRRVRELIFAAVKVAGVRAIVSKSCCEPWMSENSLPEGVFIIGNVPHDWLFRHVSCVVHHGGAGTTAAGITLGKPTVIVPFFGDQFFWGDLIARRGVGPVPIPFTSLTAQNLSAAITQALDPHIIEVSRNMGDQIRTEKGAEVGAQCFNAALNMDELRCDLVPERVAVCRVKNKNIRLCAFAAKVLFSEGTLSLKDLEPFRPKEYETEHGPWDPISGLASATFGTVGNVLMGVADGPMEAYRAIKARHEEKRVEKSARSSSRRSSPPVAGGDGRERHGSTSASSPRDQPERDTSPNGNNSNGDVNATSSNVLRKKTSPAPSSAEPSGRHDSTNTDQPSYISSQHNYGQVALGTGKSAGKGVVRIVGAGLKSPLDFTHGLARGFHNAPKLYGDTTVRQADKITGFQSGLVAAGKGFGYGLYDGLTGFVTQPIQGAREGGGLGFLKGLGKGIGGVVLKPAAGACGVPGYAFMGVYEELQKVTKGNEPQHIMAARLAQGGEDWKRSTKTERLDIVSRWDIAKLHRRHSGDP